MGAQLRALYQAGQPSQLKLLLGDVQPQYLARMLNYNQRLLDARADKLRAYQQNLAELDALTPAIASAAADLAERRGQLQRQHRQLQAAQHSRGQTLARLNASIDAKDRNLARAEADRAQLERLVAELARALSDAALALPGARFKTRAGQMGWPADGQLRARFGKPRAGSLRWQGVLIGAPEGQPVQAIHQGRVVFSDYLRGQGMLLIIDHGDDYLSLYAHNQTLYKETGDWVAAGELIGRVGNSGGLEQAGLYFEIRHQGKPLDPARWCGDQQRAGR